MPNDDSCALEVTSPDGSPVSIVHKGEKICFRCGPVARTGPLPPIGMGLAAFVDGELDRTDATIVRVRAVPHVIDLEDLHPVIARAARTGRRIELTVSEDA